MHVKAILYILVMPFVIWAMDAVNINSIFKKNKIYQASIFYIILAMALTYLVVNFLMDFFNYSRFI